MYNFLIVDAIPLELYNFMFLVTVIRTLQNILVNSSCTAKFSKKLNNFWQYHDPAFLELLIVYKNINYLLLF